MSESLRYLRGQIWHWNDPVYGKKEDCVMQIDPLEETFRYSRYVLITQSDDLPFSDTILVIPCSSRKCYKTDIKIPIHGINHKTESYIRPERIFPVNPKTLSSYVCTISEKTMAEIEAVLVRLMLPKVFQMRDFKQYMITKDVKLDKYKEIKSIHAEKHSEQKGRKWDEEEINKYMKHYQEYGAQETAETYEISLATAKRYYNKFVKEIELKKKDEFVEKICKTNDIVDAISAYANNVVKELQTKGFWETYNNTLPEENGFYKTLASIIYHSLGTLVNFRFVDKKYVQCVITPNFFQIESIKFIYSKYLKWSEPCEFHIDKGFYEIFKNKIINRMNLQEDVLYALIGTIKEINGEP